MNTLFGHLILFLIGNLTYLFIYFKYRKSFKWNILHFIAFGFCVSSSYGWILCGKHSEIPSYIFTFDILICYILFYIPPFMLGIKSIKTILIRLAFWWAIIFFLSTIFYYWLTDSMNKIYDDKAFVYQYKTLLMIYIEIGSFFLASIAGFTCVYVPYIFYRINTKARDKNLNLQLSRRRRSLELIKQEFEHVNSKLADLGAGEFISHKELGSLEAFLADEVSELESALELKTQLGTIKGKIKYGISIISVFCCLFILVCTVLRRLLYSFLGTGYVRSALSIFGKTQIYIVVFVIIVNAREFFIFTDRVLIFLSMYMDQDFSCIQSIFSQSTVPLAAASFMNIAIPSYTIVLFPWLIIGDEEFLLFEHFYSLLKPIYDTGFLITAFFTALFTVIFKGFVHNES